MQRSLVKCIHNLYHFRNIELQYLYQTISGLFSVFWSHDRWVTNQPWNSLLCRISFLSKSDEPENLIILSDFWYHFLEFIFELKHQFFLWKGKLPRIIRNIRRQGEARTLKKFHNDELKTDKTDLGVNQNKNFGKNGRLESCILDYWIWTRD